MAKLVRLNAELRENFVAYLDGELPEGESVKVEQALASNEIARHEIESLARTWELLDVLPRTTATEDFTRKTMATLTTAEVPKDFANSEVAKKAKQFVQTAIWFLGLAALATAGFFITHSLIPEPTDELVQELPVIQNLDRYQEVGDLEFLRKLESERLWKQRVKKGARE